MKFTGTILVALFILLQYELWLADGGLLTTYHLHHDVQIQRAKNEKLLNRNQVLVADIKNLKQGDEAIEERARNDLGMIKKGETFYQVVD